MDVDTSQKLAQLCERLRGVERFALDTEFVGEKSYTPTLEIIQVAAPGIEAIIDYQAVSDLACFFDLLANPTIEKVLHAGSQDLEIFYRLSGHVPAPIFDTQVAAAMLGYGAQPGYSLLVEKLVGARVDKSETMTNWSRRPLTAAQREYAIEDVCHLLPMRERLVQQLRERGRLAWVMDEFGRMTAPESYNRPGPDEMWQRVKGASSLRPRQLAILRELASWRDREARRLDRTRGSIVRDDILVTIARKTPATVEELRGLRGLYSREIDRYGQAILAAVKRGQQVPRHQLPHFSSNPALNGQEAALLELLQGLLRARADEAGLAPALIANNSDLQTLVETRGQGHGQALPLLRGWRREIVGSDLLRIVQGRADVGWDSQHRRLRLIAREGERV
ncbi:MAG TPA: ribonuclease D [Chloroflexi bacterium]|nr:ribonuclease D [Chloroflexota bacterium]